MNIEDRKKAEQELKIQRAQELKDQRDLKEFAESKGLQTTQKNWDNYVNPEKLKEIKQAAELDAASFSNKIISEKSNSPSSFQPNGAPLASTQNTYEPPSSGIGGGGGRTPPPPPPLMQPKMIKVPAFICVNGVTRFHIFWAYS